MADGVAPCQEPVEVWVRWRSGPTCAFELAASRKSCMRWRQEVKLLVGAILMFRVTRFCLLINGNIIVIGMPRSPSASIRRGSTHRADVLVDADATRVSTTPGQRERSPQLESAPGHRSRPGYQRIPARGSLSRSSAAAGISSECYMRDSPTTVQEGSD